MDPAKVTVVDGKGQLLSSPTKGAAGAGSSSREEMTAEYESRQVKNLQTMLDRVLGPGRAVAQVTAQLNFDAIESTNEKLTSDPKTAPIAETTTSEKYQGAGSTVGGVLGTDNLAVPNGNNSGSGQYDKTSTTKNNSVSKQTTKTVAAPGAVSKQSVSVVVDAKAPGLQVAQIQQMVATAAGIDAKRGDTMSVTSLPFDTSAAASAAAELQKAESAEQRAAMIGYAKQGAIALVALIALLVFWLKRRKRKKSQPADPALHVLDVDDVMPLPAAAAPEALTSTSQQPALLAASEPLDGPSTAARRREEVAALVERQPEEVAELLRGWLADRRG